MSSVQETVNATQNGLADLMNEVGDTKSTVNVLQQAVNDLGKTAEYVRIQVYEDEPCIELGDSDSNFKLMITNTRIMFMNGSTIPTYIDTEGLNTNSITVNKEFRQAGFVWAGRSNGNYGLQWKGVIA